VHLFNLLLVSRLRMATFLTANFMFVLVTHAICFIVLSCVVLCRHVCPANQDTARPTKFPCCCSNCLEHSYSSSALAIHQSRIIQSRVEKPSLQPSLHQPLRTICFKSEITLINQFISDSISSFWLGARRQTRLASESREVER